MKNLIKTIINIKTGILSAIIGSLVVPVVVFAVAQINGQVGDLQNFQNDTNVILNSSGNIHSLGWQGLLPVSRGGIGIGSFSAGSIVFSDGTKFAEDNQNLFWDDVNNRLGIGINQPTVTFEVSSSPLVGPGISFGITQRQANVFDNLDSGLDIGHTLDVVSNSNELVTRALNLAFENNLIGGGTLQNARGLSATFISNTGSKTDNADFIYIENGPTNGIISNTRGVKVNALRAGNVFGIDISNQFLGINNINLLIGSSFETGNWSIFNSSPYKNYLAGDVGIGTTLPAAKLDVAGTIRGNSTIFLGNSNTPACIEMADSDGDGITYIIANDGVLSASTTKPSICQ